MATTTTFTSIGFAAGGAPAACAAAVHAQAATAAIEQQSRATSRLKAIRPSKAILKAETAQGFYIRARKGKLSLWREALE